MKTRFVFLLIACLAVCSFTSCSDDKNITLLEITVASETPLPTDFGGVLYAKEKGSTRFVSWDNIEGFAHEAGYEYVLKVWQEQWHNGEIMDAGIYRYKLADVISKTKKDSEDIPQDIMYRLIASQKTNDPTQPYYARRDTWEDWAPFPDIEGFDYEEGHEYSLLIFRKFNGSNATPKYTYYYNQAFSKEQKDSEDLPQ